MNILVTGGAGFIGSHLCERLIHNGHSVYCLDNFTTGNPNNVAAIADHPRFQLIEHDLMQPFSQGANGNEEPFADLDYIYHLAAPDSPVDSQEIPLQTLLTHALGTKHALDIAGRYFLPFLYVSSFAVYNPVNTFNEQSCHSEGKRFAEALCYQYWRHFQFPLNIVRLAEVYGPRMRKHGGQHIPEFIHQALQGEPIRIVENGAEAHYYYYIDDAIEDLVAVIKDATDSKSSKATPQKTSVGAPFGATSPETFPGPLNLGRGECIPLKELAQHIIDLTNSESLISHVTGPRRAANLSSAYKDMKDAPNALGGNTAPYTPLQEGLLKTIAFFRSA